MYRQGTWRWWSRAAATAVVATGMLALPALAASPRTGWVDITRTQRGQEMIETAARRHTALGVRTKAGELHAWRTGRGEYLVARSRPTTALTRRPDGGDGPTVVEYRYEVGTDGAGVRRPRSGRALAAGPSWSWIDGACFSRMGNASFAWFDTCYQLHKLTGETDHRDFYQLHQFGSLGAGTLTKLYSGWLKAARASGSSTMAWIDWSPRSNTSGPCQSVHIKVEVLGVSIQSPAFFCERITPVKSVTPGSFEVRWECGCLFPFGQPYPNVREIESMQAVSVRQGGSVRWTISAGYSAR